MRNLNILSPFLIVSMTLAACGPRPAEATATPDSCPDLSGRTTAVISILEGNVGSTRSDALEARLYPEFKDSVGKGCVTVIETRFSGNPDELPPGAKHAILTYFDLNRIQGADPYPSSYLTTLPPLGGLPPNLRSWFYDQQQPFHVDVTVDGQVRSVLLRLEANQIHVIVGEDGLIISPENLGPRLTLQTLINMINAGIAKDADPGQNLQFRASRRDGIVSVGSEQYSEDQIETLAAILPTITSSPTPTPSPSETPMSTPTRDPATITPAEAANTSYQIIANEVPQPDHVTITLRPTESAPIALTTFPYPRDYYQTLTALINNPNTTYSDLESILGKLKWGELLGFWPFSAPPEQKTTVYKDGEVKLNVLGYYPLPFSTTGRKALVWGYDPDTKVVGYSIITAADLPGLTIFTPDNKNIAISPPANNLYSLLEWQLKLNSRDKDGTVYNKLYILPSDYLETLEDIPASLHDSYLYAIARIHPSVPVFRVGTNGEMTPIDIKTGALATDVRLYSSNNGLEYLIGTVQPTDIAGDTTTGEITIAFQLNQGFSANFEEKHDTPEPDTRPTFPPTLSPSPTPTPSPISFDQQLEKFVQGRSSNIVISSKPVIYPPKPVADAATSLRKVRNPHNPHREWDELQRQRIRVQALQYRTQF